MRPEGCRTPNLEGPLGRCRSPKIGVVPVWRGALLPTLVSTSGGGTVVVSTTSAPGNEISKRLQYAAACETRRGGEMHAECGDQIVIETSTLAAPRRRGEVVEGDRAR
jgi:hypothetical protein